MLLFSATSCQKVKSLFGGGKKSSTTGWAYNDKKNGGIEYREVKKQKAGPGLVFIPGGTFILGQTQEDVMKDWNNIPRRVSISSFYIDQHEVQNIDWLEYLSYLKRVFVSYPEVYRKALPDTLVWRNTMSYNEPYVTDYLRNPSFAKYPVVGVSWEQANEFCIWRTDRVNEQILIDLKVLSHDPENQIDENNFNTEAYLAGQYTGSVKNNYKGVSGDRRPVRAEDGILLSAYRLPTEAEWEYAAYALIGNTQDERISNSRIYPWDGSWVRNAEKKNRGRMMANFARGEGDYSGVAGDPNDGYIFTSPVMALFPNDYGLYDMAGNVNEWVADVYRPLSFQDVAADNPFRGNMFTTPVLDEEGNLAQKDSLGRMRHRLQTDAELATRENYRTADNRNFNDGDLQSRISGDINWQSTEEDKGTSDMYYQSKEEITTLVDDESRVYKGGSFRDGAYWLNPSARRYLNQKKSAATIGFRCAMSHIGPDSTVK
ncbi:MAG: SUMF1/EgtB/PvdO family nonheme iron enzyme [Culturomica sp.]|nr:SUMF1/EgtB/PvdO family nonheme iron enzyme [Culturomica sp.]